MNKEYEVLFIARRFPPSVGGMERFAYDLSNALSKRVNIKKLTWGGSNKWLPFVLTSFFLRAFWLLLTQRNIQVIHVQDAVQAPMGWLLSIIFKKPFLIVAHGLDITFEKAFYQKIIIPFVRRADRVISISSATEEEVIKRGVKKGKSTTITLGTADDYRNPRPDKARLSKKLGIELENRPVLLTTGRLVKRKGVAWFIETVLPELVEKNADLLYLVAGNGSEKDNIDDAIRQSNMNDHVKLLGRVDNDTRTLLYQSCDVFVMPNIPVVGDMEGFGIVAHEAATAGVPVVASNLEGIKDALHDQKNGILIPTRDSTAFVKNIDYLLKNRKQSIEFGKKAREYTLKEYGWNNIAKQYMQVYESMFK